MKYTQLGKSDLKVSRLCLGCMGFGDPAKGQHAWTLDAGRTKEIISHALDNGINFFDTAIAYQGGTSEQYTGSALRSLTSRENYCIATKFVTRSPQEIEDGVSGQQHVLNSLDRSLVNLGMDHVDLYIYHMWDYNTPMEEIMEGLNEAVKSGKTRAIGISNCFAWQLAKANDYAAANGFAQFVSVQGHYNLIFREEEREMAPFCRHEGISMTPYSSLAAGRLAKHPGETSDRLAKDLYAKGKYDAAGSMDEPVILRVAELADKRGVSMTDISLAWLLTKVTSPVVGATKERQIDDMVKAVDIELTPEEIGYLEELYQPHRLVGVMAQNH